MIYLLIAGPGDGKSHWLTSQSPSIIVRCTHASHRTILCHIADALSISYTTRASIDDLISLILAAPPTKIGLDDVDRASSKLAYTILTLGQRHTIYITATETRRLAPILQRQAAIIVSPPRVDIAAMLAERYPDMSQDNIKHISAIAETPGAAINLASAHRAGAPLPQPPTQSLYPILLILSIAAISYLRWTSDLHLSPLTLTIIGSAAYYLRRLLWRRR